MYVDSDYAVSRLHGTLVRHKGRAVFVREVEEDMMCVIQDGLNGRSSNVHLDDLNLASPPLGLVNFNGEAKYISRLPMRNDWRQGVRPHNTTWGGERGVPEEALIKCMNGKYPSKTAAFRELRNCSVGVAISREFFLTKEGRSTILNYKWYGRVGKTTLRGATTLDKGWEHLTKALGKCL